MTCTKKKKKVICICKKVKRQYSEIVRCAKISSYIHTYLQTYLHRFTIIHIHRESSSFMLFPWLAWLMMLVLNICTGVNIQYQHHQSHWLRKQEEEMGCEWWRQTSKTWCEVSGTVLTLILSWKWYVPVQVDTMTIIHTHRVGCRYISALDESETERSRRGPCRLFVSLKGSSVSHRLKL